jgi:hypothetical protein
MQKIKILTNHIPCGWQAKDIHTGLGGSEEAIILFATALQKTGNFEVYCYITFPEELKGTDYYEVSGVTYFNRSTFNPNHTMEDDIFIAWKEKLILKGSMLPKKAIFWSSEIDYPWQNNKYEEFIHISDYHKNRNVSMPTNKKTIPLGVDLDVLNQNKTEKETNTILYCSSLDRGLITLLEDWEKIKTKNPDLKLFYTDNGRKNIHNFWDSWSSKNFFRKLEELSKQKDVINVGLLNQNEMAKMFWRCEYWCLPLNNAESELFCLNAIKSKYCSCIPIVKKIGALQNTVDDFIDYDRFVKDGFSVIEKATNEYVKPESWEKIILKYWLPILEN